MNIRFTDPKLTECQEMYNALDPEMRITMSHFDLAQMTEQTDHEVWLKFLKDPRVNDAINEELQVYKQAQQRKLISQATVDGRSTGLAQMISSLGKEISDNKGKEGDIFVYSYVPLTESEKKAPDTRIEDRDLFKPD